MADLADKFKATLPIAAAAAAAGVSAPTLRRWIAAGAPVARRGRRGRGGAALIDVAAIEAWRGTGASTDALRAFAGEVPQLVADAVDETFRELVGPHKRSSAGPLAACWFQVASALLDRLRRDAPEIPELSAIPERIEQLQLIAHEMSN